MARILYGVHGTGHGHAIRALTVARHFSAHEFLFVSHGAGADLLRAEFPVVDCANPETPIRGHRVALAATLGSSLRAKIQAGPIKRRLLQVLDRFQPDATMTDYEYFVPQLARQVGLPCLSLDNQHVITWCRHTVPFAHYPSFLATSWAVSRMFTRASDYIVISFFRPPFKPGIKGRVLPPLLRESLLQHQSRDGGHVVAYQGYTTFKRFLPFLRAIPSRVMVYGVDAAGTDGNLKFKKNSEPGFLDDLSSCRYVVCGGSMTLLSEALHYGKPVISFPIKGAFEQFINAFYLQRLGYGRYFTRFHPNPEIIPAFEARLEDFRRNIRQENFYGNPEIFARVEEFIRDKRLAD
jgi:uncharacterized protein (TIGR00661 family)